MKWLELTSTDQFKDLVEKESVLAIFKHSTRCGVSSVAKNRLEREWPFDFPVYYLDVLRHRDVSDLIEKFSGIRHESPQLIVWQNAKPVYHASHNFIFAREVAVI